MRDVGQVVTVTGPVAPAQLGIVLSHEHLFADASPYFRPHPDPLIAAELDGPLTMATLGHVRADMSVSLDNQILDDAELAIAEVTRFARRGGRTICDMSSRGLRVRDHPAKLLRVARATGVQVVAGTGYYVRKLHRGEVTGRTPDELASLFLAELTEGIDGTGVRAGVIGEIGLSTPPHPDEELVLTAAARAQCATGVALVVHQTDQSYQVAHHALDLVEREGVDLRRVVIAHSGDREDNAPMLRAARRGAFVAFDNIGFTGESAGFSFPTDDQMVQRIVAFVDTGYGGNLLLSQDVAHKHHLRAYGGFGYDHILTTVRSKLERAGLDQAAFAQLMVDNPARMLTIAA